MGTLSLSGRITVHTGRRSVSRRISPHPLGRRRLRGATLHLPRFTSSQFVARFVLFQETQSEEEEEREEEEEEEEIAKVFSISAA